MRIILSVLCIIVSLTSAQSQDIGSDIENKNDAAYAFAKAYQEQLNATYKNPDSTILSKEQLKDFKGLDFYKIDTKYRVTATFTPSVLKLPVAIETSTGVPRTYNTHGTVTFEIDGEEQQLTVFQNPAFIQTPNHKYKNTLLLGFTDTTSGQGSYGSGRYVDILTTDIQNGVIVIDFNKAYNPYCAYTEGYSCAIPPAENELTVAIKAGVKLADAH